VTDRISEGDVAINEGVLAETPDLPTTLPALEFPSVPRRPQQWTKQPRAKLLPDRWIAVAEWEDHTGESHRTAIAGDPVRDPLEVGPSPESVAEDALEAGASESDVAPGGTEWMVDFLEAVEVGMGLRLPLTGLSGFDPKRGFTRLSVVGVRSSVGPTEGSEELADLLDAHHYTDGLSFMSQGTPTNTHEDTAGEDEEFHQGLSVEAVPPLVEDGDLSDGDLLARALAIDPDDDGEHVFANVAHADNTEQRDARHMNSALWPATIGYSMANLYVDNEIVGNPSMTEIGTKVSPWSVDPPDRKDLETEMLWLDAYRRHFIRYVRARGPLPTLRAGDQPYGVLPASPIETERDLSLIDPEVIADLGQGDLDIESLEKQGHSVETLAANGVEPTKLVEAGAKPDTLVDAGVDPKRMVAGGVQPAEVFDAAGLVPDSLLQDGAGIKATSRVSKARLMQSGIDVEKMNEAGITPRAIARGEVTEEQLAELGLTTEQIADVVLPEQAKRLGLSPAALERAGITPKTLLSGEFSQEQVEQLGLTTRAVADAALPPELRELGVTPKRIADADITPKEILNGDISPEQLEAVGITTETVAEALLPEEAIEAGITPEAVADVDLTAADLLNGDVSLEALEAAGFDLQTLESALLPDAFQAAGITPENLLNAGITPDAVLNGQITPDDLVEAGLTPTRLADAGLLPEAVDDVSQVITDLIEAGLDPMTLLERGLTPDALVDAGVTPETLIEAGLAPKHLVEAGVDAIELAAKGATSAQKLLDAGVSPAKLARAGVTVADVAGGDVPVKELVQTGTTVLELVSKGADELDLASEGARPSSLREANVDAGTLREAGKAAGSLRTAGYTAQELLDSGYTIEELLNGGFSTQELSAAGVDPTDIDARRRDVSSMLAAGHAPQDLKQAGFAPEQLVEAGLDIATLTEAGYTAGELVDAGLETDDLIEAGMAVADLRAADVDTGSLLGAGVDIATLRDHGATAEELLQAGHDPKELLDAGIERTELEVAGVDVDGLLEDAADDDLSGGDIAGAAVEGLQYAATVMEDPNRAEQDAYSFSFDPAIPKGPSRSQSLGSGSGGTPDEDGESAADGGVQSGQVPIVKQLSIDDRLDGRLKRELRGFGSAWELAVDGVPFGHDIDSDGVVAALSRSGLSTNIRHRTMLYSGEYLNDAYHSFAAGVCKDLLKPRATGLRRALSDAGLEDRDPRITYFAPLDGDETDPWIDGVIRTHRSSDPPDRYRDNPSVSNTSNELWGLLEWHVEIPGQDTIERYDLVDYDISTFIDVLLDSSVEEVHLLGDAITRLDADDIRFEYRTRDDEWMTLLDLDESRWDSFDSPERRRRLVRAIEDADDPVHFARILGEGRLERRFPKMLQLAKNVRDHNDSGVLRSLLRILLQYSYLREFLTARRRLGLAFDDVPYPWIDPAYANSDQDTVMSTLKDDIPDVLKTHPDITPGETELYHEALQDAAANYSSTTSIDPRISEFTDSLQYLAGMDVEELTTLTQETLDLASHRMDAWWTSLATKRLFELREAQGTVDPGGEIDHSAWGSADSEVPRATLDPALVDRITRGDSSADTGTVDIGSIEAGAIDANRQFDPAALTEGQADTQTDVQSTDGGVDPAGAQNVGADLGDQDIITGQKGSDRDITIDPATIETDVANRVGEIDPASIDEVATQEPGLYVGGYGFVENLSADVEGRTDPEYVHAPSEQHATTAAILKSGVKAHDTDEGENPLSLDLSADRVRAGLRLIRGVRRGQSLPELLGYRFERRMHEATVEYDEPDLMQYADVFREKFPQRVGKVDKPDENDLKEDRLKKLAARDTVDGLKLLKKWENYPFGRGEDLPDEGSTAHTELDEIATDLGDDIDAAGDILLAESVHQIGQGNFDRAGGSLDALAKGAQFPDPDVIETPRSGTGLTHRQQILLGETSAPVGTPRGEAAPSLASWIGELLPDLSRVRCEGTYRWEEPANPDEELPAAGLIEDEETVEREETTSLSLDVLDLGPMDVLFLFGASREETRSELEQRLVYHLIRTRPSDPAVPADAAVELTLTETDGDVSVAELLEVARSLRELVQSTRPANALDLAHPGDFDGEGHTEATATTLRERANDAQDTLYRLASDIDERLALFDAEHTVGDGTDGLPTPAGATSDGGQIADTSWRNIDSPVHLPNDRSPALDRPITVPSTPLPRQIDELVDAIRAVDEAVPLSTVESVTNNLDPAAIRGELRSLVADLPAGSASPRAARADLRVESATGQTVGGRILHAVDVPDVNAETDEEGSGGDGMDPSQSGPLAWGQTDPAGEDIMGVSTQSIETVDMTARPEIEYTDVEYAAETLEPTEPASTADIEIDSEDLDIDDGGFGGSGGDPGEGGRQAEDGADDGLNIDWSTATLTVRAWGTDGSSWFELEKTTTPDSEGNFTVRMDFSGVDPGTSFQAVAINNGKILYSATGRVVDDRDLTAAAQSAFRSDCPNLQRLLWLLDHEELLSTESGVSAQFAAAHEAVSDWSRIETERDAVDPANSTVTSDEVDALSTLADLESFDPAAVPDAVEPTTEPAARLGLDRIVSTTGEGGPGDLTYWVGPTQALTGVRTRIERTLEDPSLYNVGAAPRLLKYEHSSAALLYDLDDGAVVSAYLDAFLAQPAWTLRYLDRQLHAEAAAIVQHLTAWLYDPASLDSGVDLSTELSDLAGAARKLPALSALFEGLPRGETPTGHEAFADHLDTLAARVGQQTAIPGGSSPESAFDTAVNDATGALRSAVRTERSTVDALVSGPPADEAFRKVGLEQLRDSMTTAASYGVYGGTPSEADGGSVAVTNSLLEQARALLKRLRSRIEDAGALDPRIHGGLSSQPVPQRVETQTDRLQTLFGDGFTVLPPFKPSNPEELTATFTDDQLVPDDQSLAAETWLQRSASHRERVRKFREARSYTEAISDSLTGSPTVGQLPYEEGDTWVGVEGADPDPARISVVARFGPGIEPSMSNGQIAGLSIDEWTEEIPADEETTGVALNYDDPGNRAPQSILLVPPPEDDTQSLDHLAATVAETASYAKRRAITLEDFESQPQGATPQHMDPPFGLFPALNFIDQNASPTSKGPIPDAVDNDRGVPMVNFGMLDWYDKRIQLSDMADIPNWEDGGGSE
jgi:hypothetical protein